MGECFQFIFGFCLMSFEFVVFQMVPDLLIGIPVGGIAGQMEHVQSALA